MSFVSIVGSKDFISVVTDGRVTGENGIPICEEYQKFTKINDGLFVAFTGNKKACEEFIKDSGILDVSDWEFEDLSKDMKTKLAKFPMRNFKFSLAIGGINKKNYLEFFTISTLESKINHFLLTNNDISFTFLYNLNEVKFDLNNKFIECLFATKDVISAQIMLNSIVAKIDETVNDNTFKLFINTKDRIQK